MASSRFFKRKVKQADASVIKCPEGNKSSLKQSSISNFFEQNEVGSSKRKFQHNEDGTEICKQRRVVSSGQIHSVSTESEQKEHIVLSAKTKSKLHQFSITDDVLNVERSNFSHLFGKYVGNQTIRDESLSKDKPASSQTGASLPTQEKLYKFSRNESKNSSKSDCDSEGMPSIIKYTPLEKQYIEIKETNPDTVLFIECGYKFRFFGGDAEVAAKELNIFCHQDHNFMTASIPTHRLHIHVSRLVSKGYKVGVVRQTETAALKAAGENRSAPFTRKLSNIYTKATLIDSNIEVEDLENVCVGGHLFCLYEDPSSLQENVQTLAILSVDLATGEIIYDLFFDNRSRFELETRLTHIQPMEVLISSNTSQKSLALVQNYAMIRDSTLRIERVHPEKFMDKDPTAFIRNSYQCMNASSESICEILNLPHLVLCCLSAVISYLEEFNLSKVLKLNSYFTKFSIYDSHMQLCGRTLRNLEVFENSLDRRSEGTLYWLLNHTQTVFGARMMKQWLSYPLLNLRDINDRLDAIQELLDNPFLGKLEELLKSLPDLDRALTRIFYAKSSAQEFLSVCESLSKVLKWVKNCEQTFSSSKLKSILDDLPIQLAGVDNWVNSINRAAARNDNYTDLFTNENSFPRICEEKENIQKILRKLKDHKKEIRLLLKLPGLEYTSILGTEFLVEVKNTILNLVPKDWIKINATKTVSRFHTPFILAEFKQLSQHREKLLIVCKEEWQVFLRSFENVYSQYKKAVKQIATLDCLNSLAKIAKQHEYCRPHLVAEPGCIKISQGRHPVVSVILSQQSHQFVPNDTNLEIGRKQCMIVTGPNMGGKSSYIKQVALITLMAQVGSFVPADEAKLSIMDAIYTRMGAFDNLCKGQSTFMVELEEASEVVSKATKHSLVILDELGRGTSTHDGVAIAHAVLKYFVEEVKCLTFFVTHYPTLVQEVERSYPDIVANYHMSFYVKDETVDEQMDGVESLAFLYQLVPGIAERSYGLNVARLADIPVEILKDASVKSCELEHKTEKKMECELLFKKLLTEHMSKEGLKRSIDDFLNSVKL